MPSLKTNTTCALLEQYLSYLTVVKGRSLLTAEEYRIDCLMLFEYLKDTRGSPPDAQSRDFSDVDIGFFRSITIAELYAFITYCGQMRKVTTATRARKIVCLNTTQIYTAVDNDQLQSAVNSNPLASMFGR